MIDFMYKILKFKKLMIFIIEWAIIDGFMLKN